MNTTDIFIVDTFRQITPAERLADVLSAAGAPPFKNDEDAAQWAADTRNNVSVIKGLETGKRIILPQTKEHAQAMITVAEFFLKNNT